MKKQWGLVGILTFISRFFGLARDSAIASVLGTHGAADAFYVAFRIPNLFRSMFAEGNLTVSFIPIFTETLHESPERSKRLADAVFTILTLFLILFTVAGVLGAVWFVKMTASGFANDPSKAEIFPLTVQLTRITFPYIFLVSLGAFAMGILNARKHFAMPALSPVLLNVGIIFGALVLGRYSSQPAVAIAWGVIIGGVLQLAIQIPELYRQGFFPRFNFDWNMPELRKIGLLMLPSIYGSAVYQFNLLAMTQIASYLPKSTVSYLWYSGRIIEFPLGIFAVSLATTSLPILSDQAVKKDTAGFKKSITEVLSTVWLLNIPATVGLIVLARPIVALLFYRGNFSKESTEFTAQALQYFSLGIPFISASRVLVSVFYAMQEAKKTVTAANISVVVNVVLGIIFALLLPFGHRGLALALSLSSAVNFALLLLYCRQRVGGLGLKKLFKSSLKIGLASVGMGLALMLVLSQWDWSYAPNGKRVFFVMTLILLGVVVCGILGLILKVEGSENILRRLKLKKV